MESQRALCVGINKFQNYPQAALNGCVNDAVDIVSVLKRHMGFTDDQATKANIMANLTEMVNGAKKAGIIICFLASPAMVPRFQT